MRFEGSMMRSAIWVMSLLVGAHLSATAAVTTHELFASNMVLQRDIPIPVYGEGSAGEKVTVQLSGASANATIEGSVGADGKWMLYLPRQSASTQAHTLKVNDKSFTNVLIGDVWICAGQSNMEGKLSYDENYANALSSFYDNNIRLLQVGIWGSPEKWNNDKPDPKAKQNPSAPDYGPQEHRSLLKKWFVSSAAEMGSVKNFSTVGLVLAREVVAATGVPIGLIQNAMGGTCIESWTPWESFNYPLGQKIVQDYYKLRSEWSGDSTDKTGKPQDEPSILYNSLMHPLTKYGIKGFYWWQGEHNTSDDAGIDLKKASNYRTALPVFIQAMRRQFSNAAPDFPVLLMQLHPYTDGSKPVLGKSVRAEVRAGQYRGATALPNVGIAVVHTIAVGGNVPIHPTNRVEYGMRAAGVALGKWYGKGDKWQPSGYTKMSVDGNIATIDFTPGLKLSTKDNQPPKMFVLMDGAGKFYSATAKIVGDTKIELSASGVSQIKEVRYAFTDLPSTNLINSNDLPVSTFRAIVGEDDPIGLAEQVMVLPQRLSGAARQLPTVLLNGRSMGATPPGSMTGRATSATVQAGLGVQITLPHSR
jgi:sialate O-acetylesterase